MRVMVQNKAIYAAIALAGAWIDGCVDAGSTDAGPDAAVDAGDTETEEDPLSRIAVEVECGGAHTCALTAAGGAKCWGGDNYSQTGTGLYLQSNLPHDVVGMQTGVAGISAGSLHTCAVRTDGTVWCWGQNLYQQLGAGLYDIQIGEPVEALLAPTESAASVAAGGQSTCVLLADGTARCWGDDGSGECGNGIDLTQCIEWNDCIEALPVVVLGLEASVELGSGTSFSCALSDGIGVWCWGSLRSGYDIEPIHYGSNAGQVPGMNEGIVDLAIGGGVVCGVSSDKALLCMGSNDSGQIGNGNSGTELDDYVYVPETIDVGGAVKQVSAGGSFTCALLESGVVKCWGRNDRGQLGLGYTGDDLLTPHEVVGIEGEVVDLSAGGSHTCAVISDGSMMCWGDGAGGQLGNFEEWPENACPEWDTCLFPTPVRVIGFGPE
jgi:alpha-tubulin suppressor-like RCC1 family protein